MLSVLLVDDESSLLEIIKLVSEQSNEMTVQTVLSAQEALNVLEGKTFDAIIVDYDMPDINGIGFLKILRSKGNATPVIIFTAVGHEQAAIEALNNGANFFLKKGESPRMQFRELVAIVKQAVEQNYIGRSMGTTQRIISDIINFSSDPSFAIDSEGKVMAWNNSMEQLTGVPASIIMGKGELAYAEPFFGIRKKMLVDLLFEPDDEIKRLEYMLISRIPKGMAIAVTRGQKKNGSGWTIWAKAKPIYDGRGEFIAAISTVRDVTATFGDVTIRATPVDGSVEPQGDKTPVILPPMKGSLKKKLGRAMTHYKEGVCLYVREMKFTAAIAAFDQALSIDEKLPYAWNDRGICYRETGDYTSALKSHLRAVDLVPDNPEFLFNLGETLELIGVLNMDNKYLDSAIQTLRMVVNILPNNMEAWNHLGICHKEMGKDEESRFYFDRAMEIKHSMKDTPLLRRRDEYL
ncbi:MAG: response regulator [Methanoregula sp.]|nr:response regulator [Methanoregula sp.]